jgi:hypothetical protein
MEVFTPKAAGRAVFLVPLLRLQMVLGLVVLVDQFRRLELALVLAVQQWGTQLAGQGEAV